MNSLYLPQIANGATVTSEGARDVEQQLFALMRDDPRQGRKDMVWHDVLAIAARNKCIRQAHERWTGHVSPQGYGPNWTVRQLGYQLPEWYGQDNDANNLESLAHAGDGDVDACWQGWLNSPGHRAHVLGTDKFYAAQTNVGIGYYFLEGSEYGHYWAIISAPPEDN